MYIICHIYIYLYLYIYIYILYIYIYIYDKTTKLQTKSDGKRDKS